MTELPGKPPGHACCSSKVLWLSSFTSSSFGPSLTDSVQFSPSKALQRSPASQLLDPKEEVLGVFFPWSTTYRHSVDSSDLSPSPACGLLGNRDLGLSIFVFQAQGATILLLCAVLCLVAQSCLTLCNLMDCSPPGSSVHGDSPAKNTRVGGHAFLQGIFPTQGSNPGLPYCRWILYHLSLVSRVGFVLNCY